MDKKKKDKEEFLGSPEEKGQKSSISPEVHRKAERTARVLMDLQREPKRKKEDKEGERGLNGDYITDSYRCFCSFSC